MLYPGQIRTKSKVSRDHSQECPFFCYCDTVLFIKFLFRNCTNVVFFKKIHKNFVSQPNQETSVPPEKQPAELKLSPETERVYM